MIILFNKPFGVLCQFRDDQGRPVLSDYLDQPDIYPAGRLDRDSEGLLILTADGALQHRITDPRHKLAKTYLVQVEGTPKTSQLDRLRSGITLKDGPCQPAEVVVVGRRPGWVWKRDPPIRRRQAVPTHWIELTIREGRNRQVRRMTAAVGLPTLRLIRTRVGPWRLNGLRPGDFRQGSDSELV